MAITTSFSNPSLPRPRQGWAPATAKPDQRQHKSTRPSTFVLMRKVWRRWRSRQYLPNLDDRMLRDIGVTRAEVENELNKPFWRA